MTKDEAERLAAYCAELWPFSFRTSAQQDALAEGLERVPITFDAGRDDMAKLARETTVQPLMMSVIARLRQLTPIDTPRQYMGEGYGVNEWTQLVRDLAHGRCRWALGPVADQAVAAYRSTGTVPSLASLMFAKVEHEPRSLEVPAHERIDDPHEREIDMAIGKKGEWRLA